MEIKKWIPWKWFKKEEEGAAQSVPVGRGDVFDSHHMMGNPIKQIQQEMDQIFESVFRGFGFSPLASESSLPGRLGDGMLKPSWDLGATDKAYTINVEIPGVDEKNIKLEIACGALTIQGEKKQAKEEKDKNYYRVEQSYGSFQRVLSLPGDVDQDGITANLKNGVLTIMMPRKARPKPGSRQIAVQPA
jgi:HSP20 family protein